MAIFRNRFIMSLLFIVKIYMAKMYEPFLLISMIVNEF